MYRCDSHLCIAAGCTVNFVVTTLSSYYSCFRVNTKIPDHQHAVSVFPLHLGTNKVFSMFTYGIFSNAAILYSCHWRKHFPPSPVIYNRTQQIVGIPSSFSANTTLHCVHLTLNDDQCHGTMYCCPKYASTGRAGFTWMVENPTWAVTFHWHLSWW
jgi:hypothetical protein